MTRMLWTQRQDIGPPPGMSAQMAYDERRHIVTLVGSDVTNQTWLWDGDAWMQIADIGPARPDALVWDANREILVATSGSTESTWEWSGADWTQVSDQATGDGTTAFDERRARLVRVTWKPDSPSVTWEWSDSVWTQVDDIGPLTRNKFDLVYDSKRAVMLLAGGQLLVREPRLIAGDNAFLGLPVSDSWARGDSWKAVADIGPSPRVGMASAYDNDRGRIVLFGGSRVPSSPDPFLNDTWEWDGARWRQAQDMGPTKRSDAAMAYDKGRKRLVLFGGTGANSLHLGDTWEYFDHP